MTIAGSTSSKFYFLAPLAIALVLIAGLTGCTNFFSSTPKTFTASVTPGTLTFATQTLNTTSAAQTLTLTNTGTGVLAIVGVVASPMFGQTNTCGTTLAGGATCQIQVTFTPTVPGSIPGVITVTDSATGGAQTVSVTGTGAVPTFTATLAPASLTFASQNLNTTSAAQALTLTNTGTGTLTILNVAVSPTYAQTNNCGSSLAAAASCQIQVTFTPSVPGDLPGAVIVTDDATAGPQTATLDGTGVVPPVSVTVHPTAAAVAASWQTQTFSATVVSDPLSLGVTWSVDGVAGGTASSGSISSAGVYTPPAAGGSHSVTATAVADTTKSATASVGVTDLTGVLTYHSNPARDGANSQEFGLTPSLVHTSSFGKLFSCATDGAVYAQPLWVTGVNVNGGLHNVIFATTQHGSLYAFDADASPCSQLWQVNLLDTAHGATAGEVPVATFDVGFGFQDIQPEICVTGTPVIDLATGTLYLVAKSKDASLVYRQRLHAIDLATGNEKFAGPVVIAASVSGTGDGSSGGLLAFDPHNQHQRAGLVLTGGKVIISWAGHEDRDPYHGWVMAYDAATLAQVSVFNTSPNSGRSGVWMAGGAPAVDSDGNLYFTTGNGTFDGNLGGSSNMDFGDSVLRMDSTLAVTDSFTPFNQDTLNQQDQDVSASGLMLLPDQTSGLTHLLISGGKEGRIYLLNRDNMGLFCSGCSTDTNAVQSVFVGGEHDGTPAFWQNRLYFMSAGFPLQLFTFDPVQQLLSASPASQSSESFIFPGPVPAVSASGATNGILWAIDANAFGLPQGRSNGTGPAILHAYDATNLATELWNSTQAASNRDTAGFAVKFTVPTVANGKVYVGTRTEVDVYGLLPN